MPICLVLSERRPALRLSQPRLPLTSLRRPLHWNHLITGHLSLPSLALLSLLTHPTEASPGPYSHQFGSSYYFSASGPPPSLQRRYKHSAWLQLCLLSVRCIITAIIKEKTAMLPIQLQLAPPSTQEKADTFKVRTKCIIMKVYIQ